MKTYTLTINKEQAKVLRDASELYARLGIGQFTYLDTFFMGDDRLSIAREHLNHLNSLSGRDTLGIRNEQVSNKHRTAWDAYQVIRKTLAGERPNGEWSVVYDKPFRVDMMNGLPTMEAVK